MAQEKLQIQPLKEEELDIEPLDIQPVQDTSPKMPEPVKDIGNAIKGPISKGWDWATSSIFGAEDPGMFTAKTSDPNWMPKKLFHDATSPLALIGEVAGGIGLLKGLRGLKGASKATPIVEDLSKVGKTVEPLDDFIPELGVNPKFNPKKMTGMTGSVKPKVKLNLDGTYTDLSTGEIVGSNKPMKAGESITLGGNGGNKPPINEPLTAEMPGPNESFDTKAIKPPSKTRQAYELTRGLMSVDLPFLTSAAFRQGSGLAGTKNWFKAFANNAKSFGSEAAYDVIMAENARSPIHAVGPNGKSIADEIGLAQSNLKSLTQREEQIRSVITEKIPLYGRYVRASNRGYTAFLNTLRTKTAEDWLKAYEVVKDNQIVDSSVGKKIGNTINELTGHGSLNIAAPFSRFTKSGRELSLEKAHDALSLVFFSPRLLARDARMMNPLNYVMTDKLIRAKYFEGAIRRAGVWATFTGLASLGGAKVSGDITNSDFGKARIGDTRLDAGTGLLQWLVLNGRQALGETTSSTSGKTRELGSDIVAPTRTELVTQFGINRLHPSLGLLAEAGNASKSRPFHPGSEIAERMLPMFTSDIMDLIKTKPELGEIMLGLMGASASMGTMTYEKQKEQKPTFDIPGDIKFQGGSFGGR